MSKHKSEVSTFFTANFEQVKIDWDVYGPYLKTKINKIIRRKLWVEVAVHM